MSWDAVADDGGDEVYAYEVQMAAVDPLKPDALDFECLYTGLECWALQVGDLTDDTEYVLRVAARNGCGRCGSCESERC